MKRRQRKNRLIRAAVQLVFFVLAPSLFSTAFAGVKSIFLAIGNGEPVEWNSFLNVTGALLLLTCIFGRHFCGYACAFGSLGDAVYEGFSWIWRSVFRKKKKPGYSEKMVARLQKVKYVLLALLLLSCVTGVYPRLQGSSPWDVFSMLTSGRLPGPAYRIGIILLGLILIGMCTQERFFVSSFVLWEPYSLLCRYCRERCLKEKGKIARKNAAYAKCAALHIWTLMVTRPGPVSVYAAMLVKPYAQEKTSIQEKKYTIEKNS